MRGTPFVLLLAFSWLILLVLLSVQIRVYLWPVLTGRSDCDTPHRSVPPAVAGGSITLSAMVELWAHPLPQVVLTRLFLPREARAILSSVDKPFDHSP